MRGLRSRLRRLGRSGPASTLLLPILTLLGGTAAAQALAFAVRPLLTRLYTPDAFGVFTIFTTLIALGSTVASGGYRSAILLPRSDQRAGSITLLALLLTGGTSLLALLGVTAARPWIEDPALRMALWLLPVAVAAAEVVLTLDKWHTRFERFGLVSRLRLVQSAVVVGVQVAAGLWMPSGVGLVAGATAGFGIAAGLSLGIALRLDAARFAGATWAALGRLAARYQRFPRYSAPAALLNIASSRAPLLIFAVFFGTTVVGHLGVAYGTLAMPLGLLTGAVGHVFFVRAAEAQRSGAIAPLTRTVLRGIWVATLYPALVVLVAGPTLFSFVFGAGWAEAGHYAQLTAPWVLLAAVAAPLTSIFDVLERQRADLAFSGLMFVVLTGTVVAGGRLLAASDAVLAVGIAGAVLRAAHIGWMGWLAGLSLGDVAQDLVGALVRVLPFVAVVAVVEWSPVGAGWTFAAAVLAGGAYLLLFARPYLTPSSHSPTS